MNRNLLKKWAKYAGGVLAAAAITLFSAVSGRAAETSGGGGTKTVEITTSNYNGGRYIQEMLDLQQGDKPQYDSLVIVFKPGTYKITEALLAYGNTSIEATGATIQYTRSVNMEGTQGRLPLFSNACSGKKGYTGASNISINGGTWDFQGKKGQINYKITMEAIRFMHGSNYTLTNMTFQNLYLSHYLTIEGVENVTVKNCVFKNYTAPTVKKEAIHVDCMHNDSMAPSNQENTIYDDTICNNVTVTGCTFDTVPRGVGTHIAVAGLYPSQINISGNKFTNITYEAIKAYHYKNVTIENNSISHAGFGIKAYLYADPEKDNDKDEEGANNYQTALKGTVTEGVPSNLNLVIRNNQIDNIQSTDNGFGIHIAGSADREVNGVTVENNTVTSTKLAGIYASYATNIALTGNKITGSGKTGLLIDNCSNVNAASQTVANAGESGILSQFSDAVTLSGNTVSSAKAHSIYMQNTTGSKILSNTVQNHKKTGICTDVGCDGVEISQNKVLSSGKIGIMIVSPSSMVKGNQIQDVADMGIYAADAASSVIDGNTVKNLKGNMGIYAKNSKSVQITNNKVQNVKKKIGIYAIKCALAQINSNTVKNVKKKMAIYVTGSDNTQITSNVLESIKTIGIIAHKSTGIKVKKNTIRSVGNYGVLFQFTKSSSASGNKIYGACKYAVLYAKNAKNRKQNLNFRELNVQKGKKKVTGRAVEKLTINVTVDGRTKTKKTNKKGKFSVKTKKLKKGMKVRVQMTDALNNVYAKTVKVK